MVRLQMGLRDRVERQLESADERKTYREDRERDLGAGFGRVLRLERHRGQGVGEQREPGGYRGGRGRQLLFQLLQRGLSRIEGQRVRVVSAAAAVFFDRGGGGGGGGGGRAAGIRDLSKYKIVALRLSHSTSTLLQRRGL